MTTKQKNVIFLNESTDIKRNVIGVSLAFIFILCIAIFTFPEVESIAVQGNPGTAVNDASSNGSIPWSNPENVYASDNNYSTAEGTPSGGQSYYLKSTNFSFSIPSGATIDGILVSIERFAAIESGGYSKDQEVRIVKNGNIGTTDKANTGNWPSSDAYASYGNSTDLWGETWTPADINSGNFGVAISADIKKVTAYIDHINITIYYSMPPPNVTLITPPDGAKDTDGNVTFTCNAAGDNALVNITLYVWNSTGAVYYNNTKTVSGTSNQSSWTLSGMTGGYYAWNCLSYDNDRKSAWASSNRSVNVGDFNLTFLVNNAMAYTTAFDYVNGTFNNAFFDGTGKAIKLNANFNNGSYVSQIFDAVCSAQWINISWAGSGSGELPNNRETETRFAGGNANMTGNVLLLHMNEASGVIVDYSGMGNNGTNNGAGYGYAGKFNTALRFDGINDYINVSDSQSLKPGKITVEAWVKVDTLPSPYPRILSKETATTANPYTLMIRQSDNVVRFCIGNGGSETCAGNAAITFNAWYHLVGTYNGTTIKTYINGILNGTNTETMGIQQSVTNLLIGNNPSNIRQFNGTIDEVSIYNRTLSDEEILGHYKRGIFRLNLSVRSCGNENCSGESFMDINGNSPQNLSAEDNEYFQYRFGFETDNTSYTPEVYNVTIYYASDTTPPDVILISPNNNSGANDCANIKFYYNVSDESKIANCTIYLYNSTNDIYHDFTLPFVQRNETQQFVVNNMDIDRYLWYINCTDRCENTGKSGTRYVSIIKRTKFSGNTTDFAQVDVSNISNLMLEEPLYGMINFTQTVNLSRGADLDANVNISPGICSINASALPQLNKTSNIKFYSLHYAHTPVIYMDGILCSDSICAIISYAPATGLLEFNVSHWTSFSTGANSNLSIWDETDEEMPYSGYTKYMGDQVKFFANYTNSTSREAINGSGVCCEFTENSSGSWSTKVNMTFNSSTLLYEYNGSFPSKGTFRFNITCNGSSHGYEVLSARDNFTIGPYVTSVDCISGAEKNEFDISEYVCANGTGSSNAAIYVCNNRTWTDGDSLNGAYNCINVLNVSGSFSKANLTSFGVGYYDIVLDNDKDGYYNTSKDALDTAGITDPAGFYIYPESSTLILLSVGLFVLYGFARIRKKSKKTIE